MKNSLLSGGNCLLKIVTIFFLLFPTVSVFAQDRTISGTITESNGEVLPGVSILVKGTSRGSVSDFNGNYKVNISSDEDILIFSYVGYESQEILVGAQSSINLQLEVDNTELKEVVVTALGIEREKKALGYSVQEVQGEDITEARETNLVNSLSGKVAGVQVSNGSSGLGASSRIIIRGESSLAGKNQPLFVVDGIPINNNTDMRTNSSGIADNMKLDYGNGAAEINPDDIASMSVLKGATATALYGARGAGGVVLITTKSGKGGAKFGVDVNSNITFETVLASPEYQRVYGQGKNEEFSFTDGFGNGTYDGVDESWGPRMDGQLIKQFDSPTTNGVRGGDVHDPSNYVFGPKGVNLVKRGDVTPTPFEDHGDLIDQFFETGRTINNSVSIHGNNDNGSFRLSYTNMDAKGITPNTDLRRNNFFLSTDYKLFDKLTIKAKANYIKTDSDHRHANSYGTESVMYLFTWFGQQVNMASLQDYWQKGLEGRQQYNYNYNYHDNPYFNMYENTNGLDKNRFIGNVQALYEITPDLSLMVRAGTDYSNELREIKRAFSTQRFPYGQYREDKINYREVNTDFLLSYKKSVANDNWYFSASFGGNRMQQVNHFHAISNNQLVIPEVYTFNNTDIALKSAISRPRKQINSLFGFGQVAYKNMIFLDITARNDWSSALLTGIDYSYFYPSVSLSAVLSDAFALPAEISLLKVRAGWANVGNDTDPYFVTDKSQFTFGDQWGDNLVVTESTSLTSSEILPEDQNSYEVGADVRFFGDRLGLDFTYYHSTSQNQIIQVETPITSGYTQRTINAAKIVNKGVELMLSAVPVRLSTGFEWRTFINFAKNDNEIQDLDAPYDLASNRVTLRATSGGSMGDMYGTGFLETEDGSLILREGLPVASNDLRYLGNYNPDFTMGITNEFTYKNLSLNILFDWRQGGELMSLTRLIAATSGNVVETLWGRDVEFGGAHPGIKDSGLPRGDLNDGVIADGVKEVLDGEGNVIGYEENDVVVAASAYHNKRYKRENESEGMYDATYVKLRELRLGYNLPNQWFKNTPIRSMKVSVVGRNLLLWSDFNHGDPELLSYTGGGAVVPGVEDMSIPSTRSYGLNLSFKF
ncbi:SusC/RagA family TonB-linked outer membrane protein [Chondrinema litorale]|uniref:SusC/RagA family TonB-linked outer membrane protein n=1 Tax=Chondrinema litorale TaxID=2994555 RepID=UPI002543743F|nr:SusC/RagA family TonB-linked outer membrane protein [Chondrinema litorale]UZR93553.1 SusC/RagA family TonB-linked outer membrane protein [Chondrinema litorale]